MPPEKRERLAPEPESPNVRITVTDMNGVVLDSWERELPELDIEHDGWDLARWAIRDLADDIRTGIE